MNPLEKFIGAVVFSSTLMFPSYVDGQQGRQIPPSSNQAPAGDYYCQNCGNYHAYQNQAQNQRFPSTQQSQNIVGRRSGRGELVLLFLHPL